MRCPKCQAENPEGAYRCTNPDCLAPQRPMGATVPAETSGQATPAASPGTTPAFPPKSPADTDGLPVQGDVLWARFKIEAELGRGGMGAVFRANDSVGGETVAVKVLLPRLSADLGARERLRTEVQRARSLRHDGVVAVYEYFDDEAFAGFSMELVEGHTLAEHLEGEIPGSPLGGRATPSRLPWLTEIAGQVATALDYIHEKGLVHRDVKPSNVMLSCVVPERGPAGLRATLMDFGIAHAIGGPRATSVGVSGSLGYIAPELQITGVDPTPAADVWSFGLLLYHTLTGVTEIPTRDMPPPSERVGGLSPSIDKAVMDCFYRAATRPSRASAVATALRGAVTELRKTSGGAAQKGERAEPGAISSMGVESEASSTAGAMGPAQTPDPVRLSSGDVREAEGTARRSLAEHIPEPARPRPSTAEDLGDRKPVRRVFPLPVWLVIALISIALLAAVGVATVPWIVRESEESEHRPFRWVQIPGGSFEMGSMDSSSNWEERPVHTVTLSPFWMADTEVTVGQWGECVAAGQCAWPDTDSSRCNADVDGPKEDRLDHPMNCVTWGEASTFAVWKGGGLPSEAQWEFAARAGTTTWFSSGYSDADLAPVGWYAKNTGFGTHVVAEKEPNPWGLYDMHGNVWEWSGDDWHDSYEGAPDDGSAWIDAPERGSLRVTRGGSFGFIAYFCRSAYRIARDPSNRHTDQGFRIVLPAPAPG